MCTGFVKKGNDLIVGFNFDVDENVWQYKVVKNKNMFYIGISLGKTLYKIHGINNQGNFGNLPYMNDLSKGTFKRGKEYQRIDLLDDAYIKGSISYNDLINIVKEKQIVNVPNCSFHSLFCNKEGNILLVEPGIGYQEIKDNYAIITNFPLLDKEKEYNGLEYGVDRFEIGKRILEQSDNDFTVLDGINLLNQVKQTGAWATRVSFVYSYNEKAVYYFLNGNTEEIFKHNI